ncbi:acyltransferase family protein [Vibrio cholerae]|uniref:acyltransferase family protein n=1 Tax=Vibrio cholerae TaxID=666 RepID=UPI001E2FDFDE|nr:acyltransferase [Vibrio cholerae]MCD1193115.1 hypothetical protein [Vibrio cholerae]HCJ7266124.1 acyltransferase [Vibrio cholerae]
MVNNIQFLRAVACLLVIFAHIELGFFKQDVDAGFFSFGSIGVDLFFIISGYIMMLVSTKYNDVLFNFTDSAHFLKRRLLRVIPLNTFFIILSIAITYAFLNFGYTNNYAIYHFPETKLSIVYFLQSTFFLHFGMASINAIAWTLQYEAIFYFLFSMSIFLGIDRFKFFSAFSFLILSISLAGYNLSDFYQVILSPLHLEFFMGIIVFKLVHSEKKNMNLSMLLLSALALYAARFFIGFSFGNLLDRVLDYGVIALLVFIIAIWIEGLLTVPKAIKHIGDASYSIYLTHWLIVILFACYFEYIPFKPNFIVFVFMNFIVSIAVSLLIFKYLERPIAKCLMNK